MVGTASTVACVVYRFSTTSSDFCVGAVYFRVDLVLDDCSVGNDGNVNGEMDGEDDE